MHDNVFVQESCREKLLFIPHVSQPIRESHFQHANPIGLPSSSSARPLSFHHIIIMFIFIIQVFPVQITMSLVDDINDDNQR
jgi:hypothetical protein